MRKQDRDDPPPPPVEHPCSDQELRKMRDAIYPANTPNQIQCDASWEQVKPAWRAWEAWLVDEYRKVTEPK